MTTLECMETSNFLEWLARCQPGDQKALLRLEPDTVALVYRNVDAHGPEPFYVGMVLVRGNALERYHIDDWHILAELERRQNQCLAWMSWEAILSLLMQERPKYS